MNKMGIGLVQNWIGAAGTGWARTGRLLREIAGQKKEYDK